MQIGIDAIALAVPRGFLELADLAEARGVSPGKFIDGLGCARMSVAAAWEDPVALAANAARRLFATSGADRERVGLCIVGTETAVDHAKPIASWVHRLAGLPRNCRSYETKHACFGGTAGLFTAMDWIASGSARGRTALIICSDIARYELRTAGEPTQGAGAIAMLISENPRLLALEPGVSGSYTAEVSDFWRPLDRKDALVDGHYSVQCYLDALSGSYEEWKKVTNDTSLVRRAYHVPYGKMARKAHRHLRQIDGLSEAEADASFAREVSKSLEFSTEIGNVYTGSLYLAIASLLHHESKAIEGERIGLFSYGSGSVAEYFAARVLNGAGAFVERLALDQPLHARRRYTMAEYEEIRLERPAEKETIDPRAGEVAFAGTDRDRRVYLG
jgi:hydroxymethylglutaryl-CoA synthase